MGSAVRRTDRCAPARGRPRTVAPADSVVAGSAGAPMCAAVGSGTGRAGYVGAAASSAVAALDVASVGAATSAGGGSPAGCFAAGAASVHSADDGVASVPPLLSALEAGAAMARCGAVSGSSGVRVAGRDGMRDGGEPANGSPRPSALEAGAAMARCGAVSGSSGVRVAGRDGMRDGGEPANGSPRPSVRVERGADLTVLRGRLAGDPCVGTERRARPGAGARLPPDVDAGTAVGDSGPGLGVVEVEVVVADSRSVVGLPSGSSDPGAGVDCRRSSSIRPGGGAPSTMPERCGNGTTVID